MGLDDFDDLLEELDDYDYFNKNGIYEEEEEPDQIDDLSLFGLDVDELAEMDEDERREAIEEAGLDPDDYEYMFL